VIPHCLVFLFQSLFLKVPYLPRDQIRKDSCFCNDKKIDQNARFNYLNKKEKAEDSKNGANRKIAK